MSVRGHAEIVMCPGEGNASNHLSADHGLGHVRGHCRTRREGGSLALLEKYDVDVVGLQELQSSQHAALLDLAGDRYETFHAPGDTENAVAWNRNRFTLDSATAVAVPYCEGHERRMPVVTLKDRYTGQQAVFVNVHNPADTQQYPHQGRWRALAVAREVDLVRQVSESGDPVFLTDDMNDRHDVFCAMTAGSLSASASGVTTGSGCAPPSGAGIDWIFGRNGILFTDYTVDRAPLRHGTSDRPFVVTRVRAAS